MVPFGQISFLQMNDLNLPGRIAHYFIDSRLTLVLVVILLIAGIIGLTYTPREENPQIAVPGAEITVTLKGASPEEVEHRLLAPIESSLLGISGVKHVYGEAHDGFARVAVEFNVGEEEDPALVRIYDHVLRLSLPEGAGLPHIQSVDVDDVPIFTLTLAAHEYNDYELRRVAERVLEKLRSVSGVGASYIVGGRGRELRINTTPEKLLAHNVGINQLSLAVEAADINQQLEARVFNTQGRGENRDLRIQHRLRSADDVSNIVINESEGALLRIADIADVQDGPNPELTHYTRLGIGKADSRYQQLGHQELAAVTIAIAKQSGVNAVDFTQALRKRIKAMQNGFLPPGVTLVVTRDDGERANVAVNTLIEHLLIAIGVVSIILLLFLGVRAALVVAVVIPLVFAAVMIADLIVGPTLNRITLYSLILALGMLVDDAIVVVENVHRHYCSSPEDADKTTCEKAVVLATHEIGNPTSLATFTVVAVFLSLLMVSGMLGEYFYPAAFNVPVAMMASLFIAYSVTPYLARRLLPVSNNQESRATLLLHTAYNAVMNRLINNRWQRWLFYLCVVALLAMSLLQPAWQFLRGQGVSGEVSSLGLPLAFLPKDNKNSFLIHIHLPETTPLEVTDRAAREVEALLYEDTQLAPNVSNWITHVGIPAITDFNGLLKGSGHNVGPEYAEIRVNLLPKSQRDISSIDLVKNIRSAVQAINKHYPGGNIQLIEDPPGPPVRATVLAELYGEDAQQLRQLALSVGNEFKQTWDMAEVWASVAYEVPEYVFSIDSSKVALAGVNPLQVAKALEHLLDGKILAQAHITGERGTVPVRLSIPRGERVEPEQLGRIFVLNDKQQSISLSNLIGVELKKRPYVIRHKDAERVEYVGGELTDSAPVYAVLDLDQRLDSASLNTANLRFNPVRPSSLQGNLLLWDGEVRLTLDAFRDMGLALLLSLAAVFLLLVAYYQSFTLPLLAMAAIPIAFIGVFPAHWMLGHSFSAASMIGVIALAGLVVRNSLLLIDFARENHRQGMSLNEAALTAGRVRLRPILLTTLAIALGTAVMVPDPVFGGLAIALIFGAITSALLGVFLIPLLWRHFSHK